MEEVHMEKKKYQNHHNICLFTNPANFYHNFAPFLFWQIMLNP